MSTDLYAKRDSLRNDYAILMNQERYILYVITVLKSNSAAFDFFSTYSDRINSLASVNQVPELANYTDYTEFKTSYLDGLTIMNDELISSYTSICETIDTLKGDIAKQLKEVLDAIKKEENN